MNNFSRIFFPLRSNTGWFQNNNLRQEIEYRLKLAVLMYDEIIIEDGTYEAFIIKDVSRKRELSVQHYAPPNTIPETERNIVIDRDIDPAEINFQYKLDNAGYEVLAEGSTVKRLKIDFYEFVKELLIYEPSFLKRLVVKDLGDMPDELQKLINKNMEFDEQQDYGINAEPLYRSLIIKHINTDLVVSSQLNSTMNSDNDHFHLLLKKSRLDSGPLSFPNKPTAVAHQMIRLTVPDFRKISFGELLELRNDNTWIEFRNAMISFANKIDNNPELLLDSDALHNEVIRTTFSAVYEELRSRSKDRIDLSANLMMGGLSLLPPPVSYGVTALNSVRDTAEFYKQQRSWTALLFRMSDIGKDIL